MPEGPFGFPRLTSVGPLSRQTDMEVAGEYVEAEDKKRIPEADIRRTIIDLDGVTGAGRVKVWVPGVSLISSGRATAQYDSDSINVSVELPYAVASRDGYEPLLKYLTAHEYVHYGLEQMDCGELVMSLTDEDLFDYRELSSVMEYYDFPQEQYVDYTDLDDFVTHLQEFSWEEAARPVEGLANVVGVRYSRESYSSIMRAKERLMLNAGNLSTKMMLADEGLQDYTAPENWTIEW